MSLLVEYTLKPDASHDEQVTAMSKLVAGLKSQGISGLNYTCFSTDDPKRFIGVLEFENDFAKQGFLESAAFAKYRETVGPTFANPPKTTEIAGFASTRD